MYLGRENVALTSAELLRGIPDDSVGCILAVHSFAYSARPMYAVRRIDEVLTEGGIIKAVFKGEDLDSSIGEQGSEEFVQGLKNIGYDVCVMPVVKDGKKLADIMLAIKPYEDQTDNPFYVMAETLLKDDMDMLQEQVNILSSQKTSSQS